MSGVKVGGIIKSLKNKNDVTGGKFYSVIEVDGNIVTISDDVGDNHCLYLSEYEYIGNLDEVIITRKPSLKDIKDQTVRVGDFIAYAFAGGHNEHLAIFQVEEIGTGSAPMARCRAVTDGAIITLGLFASRALKLDNHKAT